MTPLVKISLIFVILFDFIRVFIQGYPVSIFRPDTIIALIGGSVFVFLLIYAIGSVIITLKNKKSKKI